MSRRGRRKPLRVLPRAVQEVEALAHEVVASIETSCGENLRQYF